MGIILSALAAAGDAGVKSMDQNIAQEQLLERDRQQSAMILDRDKIMSNLALEKAKFLADHNNELTTAPAKRAGDLLAASAKGQVPDSPPVTTLSGSDPQSSYQSSDGSPVQGLHGDYADLKARLSMIADPADRAAALAQLDRQFAADTATAQAGAPMRARTTDEAMADAIEQAKRTGDVQALTELKKAASTTDKFMAVPYGGVLDTTTKEILGAGTYKSDNVATVEAGKNARANAANQTKLEVAKEKASGTYRDPATIPQEEKDLWLHQYAAANGAVPRSAPAWVKNNISTWAAEKGMTPADLSSGAAQAKFDQSSAVTSGHRAGSMAAIEAAMPALADNALEMSAKLDQGQFVPLNKLVQMAEGQISDPDLSAFKVAHMALVSEYQQVISRGGTNVTALKEAMHVLNSATSPEAYAAAVNQVKKEVAINVNAMKKVRGEMGGGEHAANTVANPVASYGGVLTYDPKTGTFH